MQVKDAMSQNLISIEPDESVAVAARILHRSNVGALPVCTADGKLRGMLTDRDIVLRCVAAQTNPATVPVREVMSRHIASTEATDQLQTAAELMAKRQVRRLPVTQDGKVVGMLSLGDVAKQNAYKNEAGEALTQISMNVHHAE